MINAVVEEARYRALRQLFQYLIVLFFCGGSPSQGIRKRKTTENPFRFLSCFLFRNDRNLVIVCSSGGYDTWTFASTAS